jgi:hypothetical protein
MYNIEVLLSKAEGSLSNFERELSVALHTI